MSPVRKIGKNLVFKTLTEFIGRVLSFVFYIALARWLGEVAFGTFSLLYSVTAVFVFLVDPGLNIMLIRQVPRDPDYLKNTAGAILALKLVLSALTVIVSAVYGVFAGYDLALIGLLVLMGVQMSAFALTEYASAIFQSKEKMQIETLIMGLGKIVVTGLAIAAIAFGAGLALTLIAMTVAQLSAAVWALAWIAGKEVSLRPRWKGSLWVDLLKNSVPLAAITFFTIAFYRVDIALAPFLGVTMQQIGWYSAGIKILDVSLAIPTLTMAAAFPTLSRLAGGDYERFRKWMNMAIVFLGLAGFLLGCGIIVLSSEIIELAFGPKFTPAAEPLVWLGTAMMFMFVRHAMLNALVIEGAYNKAAWLAAMALPLNIALNVSFVPLTGIVGAAAAKLVTDALLAAGALSIWLKISREK